MMETRDRLREAQQAQDVKTIRHHRGLVHCDKLTTRALRQAFFCPSVLLRRLLGRPL